MPWPAGSLLHVLQRSLGHRIFVGTVARSEDVVVVLRMNVIDLQYQEAIPHKLCHLGGAQRPYCRCSRRVIRQPGDVGRVGRCGAGLSAGAADTASRVWDDAPSTIATRAEVVKDFTQEQPTSTTAAAHRGTVKPSAQRAAGATERSRRSGLALPVVGVQSAISGHF